MHMNIAFPLRSDGGFQLELPPSGKVVVAKENPRFRGEGQELLHRLVEHLGIAPGEIAAGRAVIRGKERIPDEERIAHGIAHAGRRVPRRVKHLAGQLTDGKRRPVIEEHVELAAIGGEAVFDVEEPLEDALHHGDRGANRCFATQGLLQIRRRGEVIGVDVGF